MGGEIRGDERQHISNRSSGAFGESFDMAIAGHIFARTGPTAARQADVVEVAPRSWLIKLPIVNVALFETDDGLVMVDSGFAPDGHTLLETVRRLTDKPLHTVVFTHGHADHAFGLWTFLDAGETPRVIAHEKILQHYDRYALTAGYNADINFQPAGSWPRAHDEFIWPDITFAERLDIRVGGERFVLRHAMGETDDAVWVWAPERGIIAGGDLIVDYLPNCGNPRKVQRWAEEWAEACDEMVDLGPEIVLGGHGGPLVGADTCERELRSVARTLRHIVRHVLDGLNAGEKPDHIVASLELLEEARTNPRLQPRYDRSEFIARNVIRRYGGWWNRYYADMLPASQESRATEFVGLAGGAERVAERALELVEDDPALASHLAEWALLADESCRAAQDAVIEVFERRAADEVSLMANLTYMEAITWAKGLRDPASADT